MTRRKEKQLIEFQKLNFNLMDINPFKIEVFDLYKKEKEAFENGTHTVSSRDYPMYAKYIEDLCKMLKSHLTKNRSYQKKRIDDPVKFDLLKENYSIEKEDNIELHRFPEPDYFTTKTEYYEYFAQEYQYPSFSRLLFAFKLRHTPVPVSYTHLTLPTICSV